MNAPRLLSLALLVTAACADGGVTVTVRLGGSTAPGLDPFDPAVRLARTRVTLRGPTRDEAAIALLEAGAREAVFQGFPGSGPLEVRVEGLDALGAVVAYGEGGAAAPGGDLSLEIPLRRNLAYVTHLPVAGQRDPAAQLYVFDVATRQRVAKLPLPEVGSRRRGRGVSARGGDAMLVVFEADGAGKLGILSAEDHAWRIVDLPGAQDLALGVAGRPTGLVAGGGALTFVDLDRGAVVEEFPMPVGGRVLDGAIAASGARALVVVDVEPGALLVDLEARSVTALDVVGSPSGVALSRDGRTAYLTSSTERTVVEVDLDSGRIRALGGFARPVRLAAFADEVPGVLAVDTAEGRPRVVGFVPLADEALRVDESIPTLDAPSDMVADGSGRRVFLVASGTSTRTAGLTVIDSFAGEPPEGTSALYPTDPDDTFTEGAGFTARQRYRPRSVGIIHGR